jgi:hypothetical protein
MERHANNILNFCGICAQLIKSTEKKYNIPYKPALFEILYKGVPSGHPPRLCCACARKFDRLNALHVKRKKSHVLVNNSLPNPLPPHLPVFEHLSENCPFCCSVEEIHTEQMNSKNEKSEPMEQLDQSFLQDSDDSKKEDREQLAEIPEPMEQLDESFWEDSDDSEKDDRGDDVSSKVIRLDDATASLVCPVCGSVFPSEAGLKRHETRRHSRRRGPKKKRRTWSKKKTEKVECKVDEPIVDPISSQKSSNTGKENITQRRQTK